MLVAEARSELIQSVTWHDISEEVQGVNPELADIISELSVGGSCPLYKVRYPYGAEILAGGRLHLPSADGRILPIDHPDLPADIRKNLGYILGMPVGVVLDKSIEVFLSVNGRITPLSVMTPGKIFGTWANLEPDFSCERGTMWNITAGARSIFMLPKITDNGLHKRLQRMCGLLSPSPKGFPEHWQIFSELMSHRSQTTDESWEVELLFFSKEWVEKQKEPLWHALRLYLYSYAWKGSASGRNQFIYDIELYNALESNNLKPDPYLVDTARFLLSISAGSQMGFGVAIDDEAAPVRFIQNVYRDIYSIPYAPTIMRPMFLKRKPDAQPVYYSLHLPTLSGFSPKGRKLASKKYNLKEIKYILQKVSSELHADKFALGDSPVSLHNLTRDVAMRYFHTDDDQFGEIQHASEIIDTDPVMCAHLNQFRGLNLCETSMFFCGCVQISRSK